MQRLSTLLRQKGYTRIPLKKVASGHYICSAEINGVLGTFIVDTGASHTCVDLEMEATFKLTAIETEHQAATASSQDVDTKHSEGNQLTVGTWETKHQELILLDLDTVNATLNKLGVKKIDGILGADLFHNAKAVLDYGRSGLYLK